MQALGWFDVKSPDYFWVYEAEWMSLEEIAEHEPAEYHKPGYVPFAFTAGGDHWCWWPSEHPGAVVLCPHDCNEGEFDASSFVGFLYRRLLGLLEYAWCIQDDEEGGEQDVRKGLYDSTLRLTPYLPASWRDTLNALASAPLIRQFTPNGSDAGWSLITDEQKQQITQRDLVFPLLGQRFHWMYPSSPEAVEAAAAYREIITEADPNAPRQEIIERLEAERARREGRA